MRADAAVESNRPPVDGVRNILTGVTCARSGEALDCSAPLPSMTAGRHTLEIAAFLNSGSGVVEGPRSAVLQLTVAGIVAESRAGTTDAGSFLAPDGLELPSWFHREQAARPGVGARRVELEGRDLVGSPSRPPRAGPRRSR